MATDDDGELAGGCACGALRFRLVGAPIFVNNCHCHQCQRQTGSTSVVNAFYESTRIIIDQGEAGCHIVRSGSGGEHKIWRCGDCGTAVWSHYPRLGHHAAGVRVGTLDRPDALRPDAIIFTREAMPWVKFPDDIPRFERHYDPATILSDAKMARLRALVALAAGDGG